MLQGKRFFVIGVVLLILAPMLPSASCSLGAQLSPGSAAALGMGNNSTALARGVSAMSFNPAGLGMPESPSFTLALFPAVGHQGLQPVGLSDLVDVEGTLLSPEVKEDWLRRIGEADGETGALGADVTPLAFTGGPVGLQFSTLVRGGAALNEDGAEVLLYGNAGRTGSPQDLSLQGSSLSGLAVSTVGVSLGLPLWVEGRAGDQSTLALGGTLKYSVGHALVHARDLGSGIVSDPLEVSVTFPMIVSDTSDLELDHGTGVGLDLGGLWRQGPWTVGVAVQNLVHSFEWDLEGMSYRPGELLFNEDVSESDFDARPAGQAPETLREDVADLTFKPRLAIGGAYDATPDLTVTADLGKRFGDGIQVGPEFHMGMGLEYRALPWLPLRVGAAKITDGFQFGGGLTLALGPVYLGWAGALQRGDLEGTLGSFSLSFGGF